MSLRYPFSAIAGQDELKEALLLTAVDPLIGGLLAFGDRGTGKSTAVRALAALLPEIRAASCPYHCDPGSPAAQCDACRSAQQKPHRCAATVMRSQSWAQQRCKCSLKETVLLFRRHLLHRAHETRGEQTGEAMDEAPDRHGPRHRVGTLKG